MNFKESGGITDIPGIKVGHACDPHEQTGCTVVLFENGAVCGVDVRGGGPGTHETDLLKPENTLSSIHGIFLTGGSAFGTAVSQGVMKYLEDTGKGYDLGFIKIPLVPGAVIFDLNFGDPNIRPDADMGYYAAKNASSEKIPNGNVGAGCGATVGKLCGFEMAMKGGLGNASIHLENGLIVSALVVVNAVGEIRDPNNGEVIAGAITKDRKFIDIQEKFLSDNCSTGFDVCNTTIGIICTNAALSKSEMTKVSQMAHDGLARTIYPIHTTSDGDTLFASSVGNISSSVNVVGMLAAEVIANAVLNAVKSADSRRGYLSYNDVCSSC